MLSRLYTLYITEPELRTRDLMMPYSEDALIQYRLKNHYDRLRAILYIIGSIISP